MSEPKAKPTVSADPPRSSGLVAKTVNGFLWSSTGAGVQAVLKIVVLGILARLVTPSDFGVVSAAMTVVALAELFGKVGVAPALVQAPSLDESAIRTASTVTLVTGLLAGAALFLSAPLMADLFQIPKVEPVVRAFSLVFVFTAFSVVPEALLQRAMRFRAIALVALGSYLLGYALVGISLAFAGFGIWALVWGQVAQTVLAGIAFIALVRPQMRPYLDGPTLRHLFRFGAGVTLSRLGNYVALNADYFVVGRWLGADALGYYSRAYVLLVQPTKLIGSAGEKVLYPALASVQDNPKKLLRGFYRSVSLVAMVTIPLSCVLILLAPELIRLLLGPQWDKAVPLFQILLIALVFRTAYKLEGTLLRARGAVFLLAIWQWIYAGLVIVLALAGSYWGIEGVAYGVTIAIVISYWIGAMMTERTASTSKRTIAKILARYSLVGAMIVAPLYFLHRWLVSLGLHDLTIVMACSALAGTIFLAAFLFLRRLFGEEGAWILSMVTPAIRRVLRRP